MSVVFRLAIDTTGGRERRPPLCSKVQENQKNQKRTRTEPEDDQKRTRRKPEEGQKRTREELEENQKRTRRGLQVEENKKN